MSNEIKDSPMSRITIDRIREDLLEGWIEALRERRLKTVEAWKAAKALKAEAKDAKVRQQIARKIELFEKERDRADKAIDKLEKRALDLRALVLQLED